MGTCGLGEKVCGPGGLGARGHACLSVGECRKETGSVAGHRLQVQSSALPLTCYVTLGSFLTLSGPQPTHRAVLRFNGLRPLEQLEPCLVHGRAQHASSRRFPQASENS